MKRRLTKRPWRSQIPKGDGKINTVKVSTPLYRQEHWRTGCLEEWNTIKCSKNEIHINEDMKRAHYITPHVSLIRTERTQHEMGIIKEGSRRKEQLGDELNPFIGSWEAKVAFVSGRTGRRKERKYPRCDGPQTSRFDKTQVEDDDWSLYLVGSSADD